ncbi:MAG TPA: proprotein convertase P-domain-containing protein, partial [Pyrinomonadaceae bacterium]|nr:proprotein convertase P-domain-containing protein [Pyrinomonadaceae bacterium]
MYRAAYRNLGTVSNPVNSYVMNWTVNVSGAAPTDAGTYQAAPRWTELRRSAAGALSVFDQGTHAPDPVSGTGRNRWLGGIAQDNQGNLALGFSRSGPGAGEFPDIVWAGRTGGQTSAGMMNEGEATMFASTGFQGGFGSNTTSYWGFYSMMTVDPSDNCNFWYTNEYRIAANEGDLNLNPFRWNTRIGKFKFPTCAAAPRGQIAANVTYCSTGAPVNNARVAANAGNFIRTTNASGSLISNIIAAPGNYTVTAGKDNLSPASLASTSASVVDGNVTTVNLCLNGVDVEATTAAITGESCALNNAADPGETMTVNLGLKFVEGSPTSNLTATLLPTGGVTNPGAPQNYGSLNTDGTPTTRSFTFTVAQNVVPETLITLRLELTDTSSNLGTVTYTIPVGRKNDPGQAFNYTGDSVTVPANEERTITVDVSGVSGTIEDLDFIIREKTENSTTLPGIAHTRIGDLELNLTSPQGTTVRLIYWMKGMTGNLAGCESDNIINTTLDDSASVSVDDACPGASETSGPLSGKFKPNSPLSAFNGVNPNGTWTL